MSDVSVLGERFWREYNPELADTLSSEQRAEIDRILGKESPPRVSNVGDLRLSFYFFFVRILWGREKRSFSRIKREQEMFPAMSVKNAPVLASLFAGYFAVWYLVLGVSVVLVAMLLRG